MRLIIHVGRLLVDAVRFGVATRKVSIIVVVAIGLALVALTTTAQVVAPLALYPFA